MHNYISGKEVGQRKQEKRCLSVEKTSSSALSCLSIAIKLHNLDTLMTTFMQMYTQKNRKDINIQVVICTRMTVR
jgi:hypothetical protein